MATVHLGRLLGPVGFSRTVAIKRLHAQFASDPEFVSMFLDEARLAARIRHPNVVPTLDVVATGGELFLVMDYVPGESIARLSRALRERQQTLPLRILSAVMAGVLHGLHAAHEAKDERGHPLGIVHRDMSPQNVLVGTDGVARILDFGVAKAAGRMQTTRDGQIKGKLSYMPPEQLRGGMVNRQSDIYAAGVMLWELVTGQRLFAGDNEGVIVAKVLEGRVEAPSKVLMRSMDERQTLNDGLLRGLEKLDSTILRSLAMEPEKRFTTAREMAIEIERKIPPATGSEVADWVEHIAKDVLSSRAAMVAEIESSTTHTAAEPREGHVQSVLSATSTLAPNRNILQAPTQGSVTPPAGLPTMTRQDAFGAQTQPIGSGAPVGRGSGSVPVDGPPVTQPSSISVSTGTHPRSPSPIGKRVLIAALIGVMLALSLVASVLVWRRAQRMKATAVADTTATTAATPDAASIASDTAPPSTAIATAPEAADPTPVSAPADAGTIAVPAKRITRPPTPPVKAPPPPPRPDCTTPHWFDEQGVKHYKPQCL
jgi:eukaryotic-like serine/threonine-protein kinase